MEELTEKQREYAKKMIRILDFLMKVQESKFLKKDMSKHFLNNDN